MFKIVENFGYVTKIDKFKSENLPIDLCFFAFRSCR